MSQVTVSPGAALPSASGAGSSSAERLTLIAQSPRNPTCPAEQQLQDIPHGYGEVAVRDKYGNALATTLKVRQVCRDGQWQSEGFVAERISAYSATPPRSNAQPVPNGYGYFWAEHGKMRVITTHDGRIILNLEQARARTSEMMRFGGLSTTTDVQAQTAKEVKLRKPSMPMVTGTQVTQWKPAIPLPQPIEKMSPVDRAKYMVKEALRVAPASARKELQALLKPQNLALMAGFAAAQFLPGVNVVADGVSVVTVGKELTESAVKIVSAIRLGLSTQQPYELVQAGDQLAEVFSHLGVGVGTALIGGAATRGAGKLGTKAVPGGPSLPRPTKLPGANNAVPFTRRPRSKPGGHHPAGNGNGNAPSRRRPTGSAVATAAAPALARTALATAQSHGIRQQGNHASHTPVPAVLPLPTVRPAAVMPLPTVQTQPEDKPQPEKRHGPGAGSSGVPPGVTRTPAEEAELKVWLRRQGNPLRDQQIEAYREGRITDKEDVLGGRTNADRKDMSAALDKIDRTRIGPSRGGGAGRSHTMAEVKEIWHQIDKRGGVDALPEATLREVTGITEQALKVTRLTPAERSDFTHRLAGARQAQTQHHKARAAIDRSKLPPGGVTGGRASDVSNAGSAKGSKPTEAARRTKAERLRALGQKILKERFDGKNVSVRFMSLVMRNGGFTAVATPAQDNDRLKKDCPVTVGDLKRLLGGLNNSVISITRQGKGTIKVDIESKGFRVISLTLLPSRRGIDEIEIGEISTSGSRAPQRNAVTNKSLPDLDTRQPLVGVLLALKIFRFAELNQIGSVFAEAGSAPGNASRAEVAYQGARIWPSIGLDGPILYENVSRIQGFLRANPDVANRAGLTTVNQRTQILDFLADSSGHLIPEAVEFWRSTPSAYFGSLNFSNPMSKSYLRYQRALAEFGVL